MTEDGLFVITASLYDKKVHDKIKKYPR